MLHKCNAVKLDTHSENFESFLVESKRCGGWENCNLMKMWSWRGWIQKFFTKWGFWAVKEGVGWGIKQKLFLKKYVNIRCRLVCTQKIDNLRHFPSPFLFLCFCFVFVFSFGFVFWHPFYLFLFLKILKGKGGRNSRTPPPPLLIWISQWILVSSLVDLFALSPKDVIRKYHFSA